MSLTEQSCAYTARDGQHGDHSSVEGTTQVNACLGVCFSISPSLVELSVIGAENSLNL